MQDRIKYWIELSDYDLETANAMLKTKRYLYVGFMCHQVIEKILKAVYSKQKNEIPPYTHNLSFLAKTTNLLNGMSEEQIVFLDMLEPLNIDSRYPEYKQEINRYFDENMCFSIFQKTKELQSWIKKIL